MKMSVGRDCSTCDVQTLCICIVLCFKLVCTASVSFFFSEHRLVPLPLPFCIGDKFPVAYFQEYLISFLIAISSPFLRLEPFGSSISYIIILASVSVLVLS